MTERKPSAVSPLPGSRQQRHASHATGSQSARDPQQATNATASMPEYEGATSPPAAAAGCGALNAAPSFPQQRPAVEGGIEVARTALGIAAKAPRPEAGEEPERAAGALHPRHSGEGDNTAGAAGLGAPGAGAAAPPPGPDHLLPVGSRRRLLRTAGLTPLQLPHAPASAWQRTSPANSPQQDITTAASPVPSLSPGPGSGPARSGAPGPPPRTRSYGGSGTPLSSHWEESPTSVAAASAAGGTPPSPRSRRQRQRERGRRLERALSLQEAGGGGDGAEEDFLAALGCTMVAAAVEPAVLGRLSSRGQRPWQPAGGGDGGWGGCGYGSSGGGGADAAHVSPGGARITLWEDLEEGLDDGGEGCEGGEAEEERHGARLSDGCGGALGQQEWKEEEGGEEVWEDGAGRWREASHLTERSSSSSTGSFKSAGRAAAAAAAAAANLPIRPPQPSRPQRRPEHEPRDSELNGAPPRAAVQPTPTGGPYQHPRDAPAWLHNARNSASSPSAPVRPASATAAYYHGAGLAAVGFSPTASPQRYPHPAAALSAHSSAPRFALASSATPLTAAPSDASCPTSSRWSMSSSNTASGSTVRNTYLIRHASASSALSGGTAGGGVGGSATAGGGYACSTAYGYGPYGLMHPAGNGGNASTGFAVGVAGAAGARSKSYHFGSGGPRTAATAANGGTLPHTAWGHAVPRGPGWAPGMGLRAAAVQEEGPGSGSSAVVPSSSEAAADVEAELLELAARANCQPASFTYGTTAANGPAAPGSVAWWGRRGSLGAAPAVDTWLLQQYAQQAVQQQQQQSPWDAAATAAAPALSAPCSGATPPLSPFPGPAQAATQRAPASTTTAAAVAAAAVAGPRGGSSPGAPAAGPFLPASASSLSTLEMISAVDWSVGQGGQPAAPLVPPSPPSPLLLPGSTPAFHSEPAGGTAAVGPGLPAADAHAAASQSQGSGTEGSATEEEILHIFARLLLQSQQQQAGSDANAPQLPPPSLPPAAGAAAPPIRQDATDPAGYAAAPAALATGSHGGRGCAAAGSDPQPWLMLPGVTTAAVSQHGVGGAAAWMGTKQPASVQSRIMYSPASQLLQQQQQRGSRPIRPASQPQTTAAAAAALAGAGHPAFAGPWLQPPHAAVRAHSQSQLQGQVLLLRHHQQQQQQQQAYHQLVQAQAAQLAQYQQQQRVRHGGLVTVQRPPAGVLGRRVSAADAGGYLPGAIGGSGLGLGTGGSGISVGYPAGVLTPRTAGAGW